STGRSPKAARSVVSTPPHWVGSRGYVGDLRCIEQQQMGVPVVLLNAPAHHVLKCVRLCAQLWLIHGEMALELLQSHAASRQWHPRQLSSHANWAWNVGDSCEPL